MTPDEQEVVRRALAATPPPGPMPPQVASRLEATITELAAVRAAELAAGTGNATGTLADLESRRRRRWPRVLVAAASVAVLAYGVGAVLQDAGPTAETAASDAGADSGAEAEGRSATQGETGAEAAPLEPPAPTVLSRDAAVVERPRLDQPCDRVVGFLGGVLAVEEAAAHAGHRQLAAAQELQALGIGRHGSPSKKLRVVNCELRAGS